MSDQKDEKKTNRRDFLFTATAAAGAVGVGAAVWPLVDQMNPDASVKALASTEVDVSSMQPGQSLTVLWRGKPVFIKRRTDDEIKKAEVEIDTLRQSAPEKINKIAVVTSTEILKKLIGAEVNNSSISAIVDDLVKKNGDKYYGH